MTRADRTRLALLTSTHVVDELYRGALGTIAAFPAAACAFTFGLRDPRHPR